MEKAFNFTLSKTQAEIVLGALAELPYKISFQIIALMQSQVTTQMQQEAMARNAEIIAQQKAAEEANKNAEFVAKLKEEADAKCRFTNSEGTEDSKQEENK